MSAEYMHIGIPITNKKPGMVYNEGAKFWVSNVDGLRLQNRVSEV